jgi:SpoIID/LytB domain protein
MNKTCQSLLTIGLTACLIGGSLTSAQSAEVVPVPAGFTITGSGFGHGVGMSQYGAQGMALDGYNAAQILTYYYQGTTVDPVALPNANIRVGLIQDKAFVALRGELIPGTSGGGAFNVLINGVQAGVIAAGAVATLTTAGGVTEVSANGSSLGSGATINITWDNTITLINVGSGADVTTASQSLGTSSCVKDNCSRRYKYGSLEISSGLFDDSVADLVVVNTLRLSDEYLYGLGEVPSSWAEAALAAQAIAGRSYAVRKTSTRGGCNCQIYATTLDQAFVGFSKEIGTSGDRWVAAVNSTTVDANTAYVVQYNGTPISTYYSSSTGGKSQAVTEVWGAAIPYLASVADPWSKDSRVNNGNANWTDSIDQATLVINLRNQGIAIADVWSMSLGSTYASGGISRLDLSDSAGNVYNLSIAPGQLITPDELRTVLGLKSTYISAITPGLATVPGSAFASVKKLQSVTKVNWPKKTLLPSEYVFQGKVSPVQLGTTVKLQRKSKTKWVTVATATTSTTGAWVINWTGPLPGKYSMRVTATNSKGTVKTATNNVAIAGKLALSVPKSLKRNKTVSLSGSVAPGLPGVVVIIESRIGSGKWRKSGSATTDASGAWTLETKSGSKKATISYRVKTSDTRLGKITSSTKKLKVK